MGGASDNLCAVCAVCVPSVCHCFGARRDAADDGGRSLSGRAAGEAASEADGEDAAQAVRAAAQEDRPAGTQELASVPRLAASSRKAATAQQVQQYEEKIRSTSSTFASHHLDEGTLEEHDNYVVWINQWATLSGFGTFIVMDMKVRCARVTQ